MDNRLLGTFWALVRAHILRLPRIVTVLRVGVVLVLYSVLLHSIDLPNLTKLFSGTVALAVFVATMLIILQAAFCAWRWRLLERSKTPVVPSLWSTFWIYMQALFCNQFSPSTIGGDLYRVVKSREAGVGGLPAATSVFLDRLSGLIGAAFVSILAVSLLAQTIGYGPLTLAAAALSSPLHSLGI